MDKLIEGVNISNLCDYSFGDQSSIICGVIDGYMKLANESNIEFIDKLNLISQSRSYMTLFIDNIRLYNRSLKLKNEYDQNWVNKLMDDNDLLELCSKYVNMNFIIFTNLEDTSIDEYIKDKIPNNVLKIYAVNAIYNDDKVIPFPYGLQRKIHRNDNRLEVISKTLNIDKIPSKLLYINHSIETNVSERVGINEIFYNKEFATVDNNRVEYYKFLENIQDHKFMICPIGNAIDCHRNWEVLYLKRVPIMKSNSYLKLLFKDFPVLFVDSYEDVTEDLLLRNDNLYQESLKIDFNKLNIIEIFNTIIKENII